MQRFGPSSRVVTVGRVNTLMVFKSIGEALPGSVASWAFSGCARSGTQDHPVYIPRAFRRPGRLLAAEHLFRSNERTVQGCPRAPTASASILYQSASVSGC